MFRIGSVLFIPAYLLVVPLRPFAIAVDNESPVVMAGECTISAFAWYTGLDTDGVM